MCEGDVLETSPIRGRIVGHAARVFITGGLARSDWDVRFWHSSDIPPALTNVRYGGKADMTLTLDNVR
jgi:hypothetical protein